MVWFQFSIKILGVDFSNSLLHCSSWDKISHILAKKNQYFEQGATPFEMKKKNCKSNSVIQTLVYRSNICYSKIYHKRTRKNNSLTPYLVMQQGIIQKKAMSGSWTLPCPIFFFLKSYFDLKMPKMFFKQGYLSTNNHYLPKKQPFTVLSAFFLFFRRFPMILEYSLCELGILGIDTQLNVLVIEPCQCSLERLSSLL